MKSFFLIVPILALTLPFLGAEEQNWEKLTHCENDKRLFNEERFRSIPIHYRLNRIPSYGFIFYQHRSAASTNNQFIPYPFYARPVAVRPHAQKPQWQDQPNVYPPTGARRPRPHASFIAIPPKKNQDTTAIPAINSIATVKPTLIPTTEPVVNTVVIPEAASEFLITSTPETTAVQVSSPVV
uniref:Kappa-casein n=1 Tax=Catagonus wagneri TaxID=51154 RepID=A0A8C3VGC8_9CETA